MNDERLTILEAELKRLASNNERLTETLKEAREQIVLLKDEIDRLVQPTAG